MRLVSVKKLLFLLCLFVVIIIILLNPDVYERTTTYEFIEKEEILENLHEEVSVNFTSSAIADCEYYDMVRDDTLLSPHLADGDLIEGHKMREGGEYAPPCKPKFSTAIIVPYRDRAEQLRGFLVYMHTFLHYQYVHYRIYVVEQMDSRPFNRAKLLNIGAVAAMNAGYPCLVFHDVDLLPLSPANLYACTKRPRHMSACINKYRLILPYLEIFGGAVAILSKDFKTVNGMSNEYFGWGGEDDDLFSRLKDNDIKICRFGPDISQYHMAAHKIEQRSAKARKLLKSAKERMGTDGLNSLKYTEVATVQHPLFTHIMVDL